MQHELTHHLEIFAAGQFVAVDPGGRVVGSASSLVVRWDDFDAFASWDTITAGGSFATHNPHTGETLYGAEIMVDPAARGLGVGSKLYEARHALAMRLGLRRMIAGGRIPGYAAVADRLTPEAYVAEVVAGLRKDPVLSFQLKNGFRVKAIIPSYLDGDEASKGFATLIEWVNPAYDRVKPAA